MTFAAFVPAWRTATFAVARPIFAMREIRLVGSFSSAIARHLRRRGV